MLVQWYNNLPKDEQESFKKIVGQSEKTLDRLREICYNIVKNGERISVSDYDNPSWAYKQADRNGYLRAYEELIRLLDISRDQ
jgi:hypothetical protein